MLCLEDWAFGFELGIFRGLYIVVFWTCFFLLRCWVTWISLEQIPPWEVLLFLSAPKWGPFCRCFFAFSECFKLVKLRGEVVNPWSGQWTTADRSKIPSSFRSKKSWRNWRAKSRICRIPSERPVGLGLAPAFDLAIFWVKTLEQAGKREIFNEHHQSA